MQSQGHVGPNEEDDYTESEAQVLSWGWRLGFAGSWGAVWSEIFGVPSATAANSLGLLVQKHAVLTCVLSGWPFFP